MEQYPNNSNTDNFGDQKNEQRTNYRYKNRLIGMGNNFYGQVSPFVSDEFICSPKTYRIEPFVKKLRNNIDDAMYSDSNFTDNTVHISAGKHHTLALSNDGECVAWGEDFTSLYDGFEILKFDPRSVTKVTLIAAGDSHSAVVSADGRVWTWGCGLNGRLGHGNTESVANPRCIEYFVHEFQKSEFLDLNIGNPVRHISCGDAHTALTTFNNRVFVWGMNRNFQCGHELCEKNSDAAVDFIEFSYPDPKYRSILCPSSLSVDYISENDSIKAVICGTQRTMMITTNGIIYSWGKRSYDNSHHSTSQTLQLNETKIIDKFSGSTPADSVSKLALGRFHTIALTDSGDVYVWGCNTKGQLGLGKEIKFSYAPRQCPSLEQYTITDICAGSFHSIAVGYPFESVSVTKNLFQWGVGFGGVGSSPRLAFDQEDIWFYPTIVENLGDGEYISVALGGAHTVLLSKEIDDTM